MQESNERQLHHFVKNSPCCEGNCRSASLCSTSCGNQRPNTICSRIFLSHSSSLAPVWTVSCNLCVGLQSDIFPSGFPINICCAFLLHLLSPLDYKWLRSERFLKRHDVSPAFHCADGSDFLGVLTLIFLAYISLWIKLTTDIPSVSRLCLGFGKCIGTQLVTSRLRFLAYNFKILSHHFFSDISPSV